MNLQELLAKRAEVWEGAKAFVESHQRENGTLSAEDTAAYEKMEAEITDLTAAIDRAERARERDAMLAAPTSEALTGRPDNGKLDTKIGRASDEYHRDMMNAIRTGFRQVSNLLQENVDADGGYLVPEELDKRLITVLDEECVMRALATKVRTSGDRKINVAANRPTAAWIEEGGPLQFTEATFEQKLLDAHKLHASIQVTEELLYDEVFNLEGYITTEFGKALANAEEAAFLNGDGNGKPTGLFHPTKGAQIGVTAQKSNAITGDEVIDLIYSLKRPYRKKACFVTNDSTLGALRKLKDGAGQYLWQPALVDGEPDRLYGFPVRTSAFAPVMEANASALAFGDFSYYNIGDRGARSMTVLRELFAGNGLIGFVMKERTDGILVLQEAVKVLKMKGE